eukprot:CAMPEP_0115091504 /NCGR_PEP_ID=MMETSP0227-20121206/26150_1 /TAXON_ID=89957 /ORGANISM="Polarella glacialis, Strain CCMP 1383" /LENGTH=631 /DNA_ID=CAMNT_0002483025 /DNA_START=68 /DNA_END=1963 /DNA_ORIENTATION=-
MVKGGGKGTETLNDLIDDKKYKDGIQEIIRTTCVRPNDFDSKAISLLDVLQQRGRGDEACRHLAQSLQEVSREKITNWRAYIYTLLKGFDGSAYTALKSGKDSESRRIRRAERAERNAAAAAAEDSLGPAQVQETEATEKAPSIIALAASVGPPSTGIQAAGEAKDKSFNQGAVEFVPGKAWTAPTASAASAASSSTETKSFRQEAAEFVPGRVWSGAAGSTAPSAPFKPTAVEFVPGQIAWTGAPVFGSPMPVQGAGSKVLKNSAAEFVPGQPAWSGAPKAKAKAKSKEAKEKKSPEKAAASPSGKGKAAPLSLIPERPGPLTRKDIGDASPQVLREEANASPASRDADSAAGGSSSQPAVAEATLTAGSPVTISVAAASTTTPASSAPLERNVGAVSEDPACRSALVAGSAASKAAKHGIVRQLSLTSGAPRKLGLAGVLSSTECGLLLSAAEKHGFRRALEQDRAGGSPSRLVSQDEWLSAELWQRVKDRLPAVWNGRWILGLRDHVEFQYCSPGQESARKESGSLVLQLCLSSGDVTMPQQGEALLVETMGSSQASSPDGKFKYAALHADVQFSSPSWLASVQAALGMGGAPCENRRRRRSGLALILATTAVVVPLLAAQRRRKGLM